MELAFRKAQRELEKRIKSVDLEVVRRLDLERASLVTQAKQRLDEEYRGALEERDRKVAELCRQLDEARRKAELGPQKEQGYVYEDRWRPGSRRCSVTTRLCGPATAAGAATYCRSSAPGPRSP